MASQQKGLTQKALWTPSIRQPGRAGPELDFLDVNFATAAERDEIIYPAKIARIVQAEGI